MEQHLEFYRAELAYRREGLLSGSRARRLAKVARMRAALRARGVTRSVRDSLVRVA